MAVPCRRQCLGSARFASRLCALGQRRVSRRRALSCDRDLPNFARAARSNRTLARIAARAQQPGPRNGAVGFCGGLDPSFDRGSCRASERDGPRAENRITETSLESPPTLPATPPPTEIGSATAPSPKPAVQKQTAPNEPLYRVFVPIDEQQNVVGDKYYVPEELYRQLHQQAARASDEPRGWLVTRARYHGALARDMVNSRLAVDQIKATFDLQVFQANVPVWLPLAREGIARAIVERAWRVVRYPSFGTKPATRCS